MKKIAATHVVSSNSLTNSGAPATVMGYITSYLIREITRRRRTKGSPSIGERSERAPDTTG
jgi:hypothetical protein